MRFIARILSTADAYVKSSAAACLMKKQTQATLYAGIAVLLWSTVASAFKLSLQHLSTHELLLFASLVSCGVLFSILVITGRYRAFQSWTARDVLRSALLGFLNPFLYYRMLFEAYAVLPAQEAQSLNFTWPIVLALLSLIVLRQRMTILSLGAMCISFVGVVVIATHGDILRFQPTDPRGVALALGSTVIWASYWIAGLKDKRDPVARLFANFAFGGIFVSVTTVGWVPLKIPQMAGLLGAVYVGTFEMSVTFLVWLMALRRSRNTAQVGNLIFLTPFLSLFFIRYAIGETIHASTLAGLILIVVGILLQQRYGSRSG